MPNFNKKQLILIALTLVLGLGLFGCGKGPATNNNQNGSSNVNQNQNVNLNTNTTTGEIDTSDWKTYRNETIGIEFKYPPEWPDLKGNSTISYNLDLIDLSQLSHTFPNYDNLSIDIQYSYIKCGNNKGIYAKCEEKMSKNNLKYVWTVQKNNFGTFYEALVATGKCILVFSFQGDENYNKRKSEYQELLSTLKIPN